MTEIHGRILVVDDNRMNRLKLSLGLENQGHRVGLAENGRQALELLKEQIFDLILLDILMPEMDGYQVLEELKIDPKLRAIPVIVISAIDEMASIIKCIEMGAEDYLPKPFDAVLLKARIGAALEKKQLRDKERLYAKSLERDLEIGRQIQSSFLPESLPKIDGWEIVTHFQAARQVSGDFYDVFKLANDSGVGFVIADVCDKGVGAALFMGLFRSLIRAFSELHYGMGLPELLDEGVADHSHRNMAAQQLTSFNHTRALEIILSHTNNYIASTHGKANMFATLFWGIIEPESGMLSYISGGHESVAVVESQGIRTTLEPTGPAVGMLPDMVFQAKRIEIYPGELLVAFTDGITEARDAGGALYGEDKLMRLLNRPAESAEDMLSRITSSLAAYTAGAEQSDDITMMIIRRS
ncbi:MAG: SpoIIE family protein phosphatase [bacterium]|nr:SpoIIE family protein phosphatase [bacterium]